MDDTFFKYCRFFIPEKRRVLMVGCRDIDFLSGLHPLPGVGVTIDDGRNHDAEENIQGITWQHITDLAAFQPEQRFDYIILHDILQSVFDVRAFLVRLRDMAGPETRVIINSRNPGWRFLPAGRRDNRMACRQIRHNCFYRRDLNNFLLISGYDIIKEENYVLLTWTIPFLTTAANRFLAKLPLLRRCCLGYFTVAGPHAPPENVREATVSVVLTCRDEEGNIEGLVERIPDMGRKTEIIFVEGHSRDHTVDKINEMIRKYPEKDIKLYHQPGIGQGDAFRTGFDRAEGDFLIWLEADLTTPPEEARHIWAAYAAGLGEYVNGTRFVYPMAPKAMPAANNLGNRFFSRVMSMVTGQRFTDTLCGFKGIPRNRYNEIINNPSSFDKLDPFGDFLLILGAVKHNLKIAEIPLHYQPREYGQPKAYGRSVTGLLTHAWVLLKICWQSFIEFRLL